MSHVAKMHDSVFRQKWYRISTQRLRLLEYRQVISHVEFLLYVYVRVWQPPTQYIMTAWDFACFGHRKLNEWMKSPEFRLTSENLRLGVCGLGPFTAYIDGRRPRRRRRWQSGDRHWLAVACTNGSYRRIYMVTQAPPCDGRTKSAGISATILASRATDVDREMVLSAVLSSSMLNDWSVGL